jgi:peptide-methionine (R)-S-oxide reductase
MNDELPSTEAQWKALLTPEQFAVLRHEGTERAWTSALYTEARAGTYVCAGCGQALYTQDMKFDSGTGWPSFFTSLPGAFETKVDRKFFSTRTEYHCARCGGHHGHVFDDGPAPTGQRWCNNGVALKFVPKQA